METKKIHTLDCRSFGSQLRDHKFVFKDLLRPGEGAGKKPEVFSPMQVDKAMGFRDKLPWTAQVDDLTRTALGSFYSDKVSGRIVKSVDERLLRDKFKNIETIAIRNGYLYFLDNKDRTVASFDISDALKDAAIEAAEERRRQVAVETRNNTRQFTLGSGVFGGGSDGRYARTIAYAPLQMDPAKPAAQPTGGARYDVLPMRNLVAGAEAGRVSPASVPGLTQAQKIARMEDPRMPIDPEEAKVLEEQQKLDKTTAKTRENLLTTFLDGLAGANYDIPVLAIDCHIRDADAAEFERVWVSMRHAPEVDALMTTPANPAEGYTYNPFTELKGNHREILRDLIQKWRNDRLYLSEVCDLIYSDRFGEVKATLKEKNVGDEVLGELHKGDLIRSYREFRDIDHQINSIAPDKLEPKYKKWLGHEAEIATTLTLLGDYVAYSQRLIQYMQEFTFDELRTATERDRTMHERGDESTPDGASRNRVIGALSTLFCNIDNPREYPSGSFAELRYLFTRKGDLREMTFADMNGTVHSIPPITEMEWMTLYQSGETAYKLAYESAAYLDLGTNKEKIDETKAKKYLNDLIQLGITAYPALPVSSKSSLKGIIDRLAAAGAEIAPGVPLKFLGDSRADATNLYNALAINDLADISKNSTDLDKLITLERSKFVRIGSVMKQKERARTQEYFGEVEIGKGQAVALRFSAAHAQEIAAQAKATGKFSEEQIQKIQDMFIGGGLVVLPDVGGGVNFTIPFDNGVSIGITGTMVQDGGAATFGAGASIGKHWKISDTLSVDINVGGGASVAPTGAFFAGVGGRVTRKYSSVDVSGDFGVGVAFAGPTAVMPTALVGMNLNWGKYQENYEKNLNRAMTRAHFDVLTEKNAYEQVMANPNLYPEFADLIYKLRNTQVKLSPASERELFMSMYQIMKEGIQNTAVDQSITPFVPSGLGIGIAMAGPIPVPYLYLTFPLWKRKLVYRMATSDQKINAISEETAQLALMKSVADGSGTRVDEPLILLKSQSEIMLDPQTGEMRLRVTSGGKMDFSFLDPATPAFEQYRQTLAKEAGIIVDPVEGAEKDMGLIEVKAQGANGNQFIHIDPQLQNDVIPVMRGARMYLSIKKGSKIYFRREDITYPFMNDGVVEKTHITISGSKYRKRGIIERQEGSYLMRTPTSEWSLREGDLALTPQEKAERNKISFMAWEKYAEWWGKNPAEHGARVQLETVSSQREAYEQAYDRLMQKVTIRENEAGATTLREGLEDQIKSRLLDDAGFMAFYKNNNTIYFDMPKVVAQIKERKEKEAAAEKAKPAPTTPAAAPAKPKKGRKGGRAKKVKKEAAAAAAPAIVTEKPKPAPVIPLHEEPEFKKWREDFSAIVREVQNRFADEPLNDLEMEAVMMDLLIASFADHPKDFQPWLQGEKGPMRLILTGIFNGYYEGDPRKEEKAKAAAAYILDNLKTADITKDGTPIPGGSLFGSVVGTLDAPKEQGGTVGTGIRRILNFRETTTKWGAVGVSTLNPGASNGNEVSRDVANMWLNKLSPYKVGAHKEALPDPSTAPDKYEAYSAKVYANLRSPLALKLTHKIAPLVLTPKEMDMLGDFYEHADVSPSITPENDAVIKKFLDACDKVRQGQIDGKKVVEIVPGMFVVKTDFKLESGLFKKCGNVSAWLTEEFVPEYLGKSVPRDVYAGMSDVIVDVRQLMTAKVYSMSVGAASPLPAVSVEIGKLFETPKTPPPGVKIPPPPPAPKIPTVEKVPPPTTDKPGKTNPGTGDTGNI